MLHCFKLGHIRPELQTEQVDTPCESIRLAWAKPI